MRKVEYSKIKVGDLVQVPRTQFAPMRHGWNGWLFSDAIVIRKGRSTKSGRLCVIVEMRMPGKGTNEYTTREKAFVADEVFYTSSPENARRILAQQGYHEGENLEKWITENEVVGCDWIRFLNDRGLLFPA